MPSTMSRTKECRNGKAPKRPNGKLRVAAILKAGAAVISEKGYEMATMAEIAARSNTKIGSLYRFFPNKEVLANALIAHYHEGVHNAFDELDSRIQSRAFSAAVGMPPHRYVSQRRLEWAKTMIAAGGTSIAEMAFMCGFSSQSSFTRAFRRATGLTPAMYRREFGS